MNKDTITERMKLLLAQKDMANTNVALFEGAIQDCQYWLNQLEGANDGQNNSTESSDTPK